MIAKYVLAKYVSWPNRGPSITWMMIILNRFHLFQNKSEKLWWFIYLLVCKALSFGSLKFGIFFIRLARLERSFLPSATSACRPCCIAKDINPMTLTDHSNDEKYYVTNSLWNTVVWFILYERFLKMSSLIKVRLKTQPVRCSHQLASIHSQTVFAWFCFHQMISNLLPK